MKKLCIFVEQRRNHVTQNNIIKNKAGIGASQNGVTSLFLHPRRLLSNLQNSDKMQRITHYVKWRPIPKFDGYFISNTGIVRNQQGILKPLVNKTNGGYLFCMLRSKEYYHAANIHQLVWDQFGNTPKKKLHQIHHKDFNILNNHIDNLEYIPKHEHYKIHGKVMSPVF